MNKLEKELLQRMAEFINDDEMLETEYEYVKLKTRIRELYKLIYE